MKRILVLLVIGSFLVMGTLVTNISATLKIADKINLNNIHVWALGFVLDFVTNPAGLLGILLIVIGLVLLKKNARALKEKDKSSN